jgi:hypothetical protein
MNGSSTTGLRKPMDISWHEFDDLRAQVMAQKFLINTILIALQHKNVLKNPDIEALFEATLAALDRVQDPIIEATTTYVEDFRIACKPEA